jgi:hypothetical protein
MSTRLYSSHEAFPGAGKPPLLFPDLGHLGHFRAIPRGKSDDSSKSSDEIGRLSADSASWRVWLVSDANRNTVIFPFRFGFTIIKKGLTIT